MKYQKIRKLDTANGHGNRVSLFVSGCTNHCPGCFNPESWDFNGGNEFTEVEENIILDVLGRHYIKGLSVLGGEPFQQDKTLINFLKKVKGEYPYKDIWCYTGYEYERIRNNPLLRYIDVLVDGAFLIDKRNPSLKFRGSSNQRIIDVPASIVANNVIVWKDDEYESYQNA